MSVRCASEFDGLCVCAVDRSIAYQICASTSASGEDLVPVNTEIGCIFNSRQWRVSQMLLEGHVGIGTTTPYPPQCIPRIVQGCWVWVLRCAMSGQ